MSAYLIGEITVTNPDRYKDYAAHTPGLITNHGGRFIVRGGNPQSLEGADAPSRVVVIEFKDMESLLGFYNSAEYQAIIPIRQEASEGRLFAVEGFETTSLS